MIIRILREFLHFLSEKKLLFYFAKSLPSFLTHVKVKNYLRTKNCHKIIFCAKNLYIVLDIHISSRKNDDSGKFSYFSIFLYKRIYLCRYMCIHITSNVLTVNSYFLACVLLTHSAKLATFYYKFNSQLL